MEILLVGVLVGLAVSAGMQWSTDPETGEPSFDQKTRDAGCGFLVLVGGGLLLLILVGGLAL